MSRDAFLGGKVTIDQPDTGYRAAMDPVLLAAAVPECRNGKVLDLGCGVGTALLCYGTRVEAATLIGMDINAQAVDTARGNAALNALENRTQIVQGSILSVPDIVPANTFDQVFANPPYQAEGTGGASPIEDRARSNHEGEGTLVDWISCMLRLTKPRGGVTVIHRADRAAEVVQALQGKAGEITIIPLWPRVGQAAKRVIIRARKGVRGGSVLHPGLVLHGEERYTLEAMRVLRDGEAL